MTLLKLRVLISSPGDMDEEIIEGRVIGGLYSQFGGELHRETIFRENAPLVATTSFQEQSIRPSDTAVALVTRNAPGTEFPTARRRPPAEAKTLRTRR